MPSSTQCLAYRTPRTDSTPDEVLEPRGDIATLQDTYGQVVIQAATSRRTMADAVFALTRMALTQTRDVAELLDSAAALLADRTTMLREADE
jgi:hypothetical protein